MASTKMANRQEIYTEIRSRVLGLELLPGAPISENELAAELGVSRTPVRESLLLLAQEGLVQVFPKIGSFVSRVDFDRVRDAQFIREAVEVASLAHVPQRPDGGIISDLERNLEDQRAAVARPEEFFRLDDRFHHSLLRLAGHDYVWPSIASIKGHLDRARRLGLREHASAEPFLDQHAQILDLVLAGDLERAVAILRIHLRLVLDDLQHAREHHPELFAGPEAVVPRRRLVAVWEPQPHRSRLAEQHSQT